MNNKTKKIAIVPGSFDPITFGHINIVKQALIDFDKVYLAVMINPEKNYMFTLDERVAIAEKALNGVSNVEVISSSGMLWELANGLHADAIIKGYRNGKDLEYEKKMAEFNDARCPGAKTILLKAPCELESVSSTLVRERLHKNNSLLSLLPQEAIDEINRIIRNKNVLN